MVPTRKREYSLLSFVIFLEAVRVALACNHRSVELLAAAALRSSAGYGYCRRQACAGVFCAVGDLARPDPAGSPSPAYLFRSCPLCRLCDRCRGLAII